MAKRYPVPMIATVAPIDRGAPQRATEFDIAIRSPSGPLWKGTLRVGDRSGEGSWSQTKSEPSSITCPIQSYYGSTDREMLSLSLSLSGRDMADVLNVQARWARRGDVPCDGLRTVEVRQAVQIAGQQPIVVTGDGGLQVELRRR